MGKITVIVIMPISLVIKGIEIHEKFKLFYALF